MSMERKCENCMFYNVCPENEPCWDFTPLDFDDLEDRYRSEMRTATRDRRKLCQWDGECDTCGEAFRCPYCSLADLEEDVLERSR